MKISSILLLCVATLALSACGGGGSGSSPAPAPEDPLAFYKNQAVNWSGCRQYFSDDGYYASMVAKLGDRLQCADINAPLDYQHPDGLQVSVSMLRVLAPEASGQKPNLFFNPGGPGGDGQKLSLDFAMLLSQGNPDTALGKKYIEMSDSYNFVGFSPRGVGASTNIMCAGNELVYETDDTQWGTDAENIRRLTDFGRYTALNCQKNPVADYVHTDATARDMDLMRHLLGDEKMHYYGTSYGTWLGFWYAGVFPERVGPMVVDSNMNFSKSMHEASIRYIEGEIHTFRGYVAPYMARHDAIFHMGATAQAIEANFNEIDHSVKRALLAMGVSFRAERDNLPDYITVIKAAIETQKLLDDGKTLDEIEVALTGGVHIDHTELNSLFHEQAQSMVDGLRRLEIPGFDAWPSPFSLDNSDSVFNTVVCNDEPLLNKDQAYWVDKGFDLAGRLPIASNRVATQPCIYWDRKANAVKPSMESLKEAPLLMVQSEYDVPTPLSGAMETFEQLPAASMIFVKNEGAHGLSVYQTECVDLTAMNYLLGQAPLQRLTECQGKTLTFDDPPAVQKTAKAARAGAEPAFSVPASNFLNPELAESLLGNLRQAAGQ